MMTIAMARTDTITAIAGTEITATTMTAIMVMTTAVLGVPALGTTTPIMGALTEVPTAAPTEILLPTIPHRLAPSRGWIFCFPATNRNYG